MCGIDEAGRGPLAGPVYSAAVVFDKTEIVGINDSKKISPKNRDGLFEKINMNGMEYSVGVSTVEEIDDINILNATHLSMKRAAEGLRQIPDLILVDGNSSPFFKVKSRAITKGDMMSYSIACASIIAKVLRDRFMIEVSKKFPCYGFDKHKGYGTKSHIDAIKRFGPCTLHRKSFLKKIL